MYATTAVYVHIITHNASHPTFIHAVVMARWWGGEEAGEGGGWGRGRAGEGGRGRGVGGGGRGRDGMGAEFLGFRMRDLGVLNLSNLIYECCTHS